MNDRLNIPKELRVGFQHRSDTYSGLLAFITYINNKGDIAKDKSWNNWRSKEIDVQNLNNEPLSGFVLNRHVGGHKSGWNFRNSYCRVWDPRGFEFEISIENLLFILDNCSSIKGRGLEGEFVYAWDGQDLLLLPTNTEDYKKSIETINRTIEIKTDELKVGTLYETKHGREVIYLGRHSVMKPSCMHNDFYNTSFSSRKEHIFVDSDFNESVEQRRFYRATDAKKLISVIHEDMLSPVECEDLTDYILNEIWKNSTERKVGTFNLKCNIPGLKRLSEDDIQMGNLYTGLLHINSDKVIIFRFRLQYTHGWLNEPKKPVICVEKLWDYERVSKTSFRSCRYYDDRRIRYHMNNDLKLSLDDYKSFLEKDIFLVLDDIKLDDVDNIIIAENEYGYKFDLFKFWYNDELDIL